ncbi:MAG TPA: class IV adenylate cyclase [Bryobacteraceae bacterium]|nr:class IV adenylate cyclase [Bryobacteraceae bacterium]
MARAATETEVKLRVADKDVTLGRIAAIGFRVSKPREFESNTLYDTPARSLLESGTLLRLRQAGNRGIITWKGKSIPGPHKSRPEIETEIGSVDDMARLLCQLGYEPAFRYDKYRTEFKDGDGDGTIVFDETPIGFYLELEGPAEWIDETASKLGFSAADYELKSYGSLYRDYCTEHGLQTTGMVFSSP